MKRKDLPEAREPSYFDIMPPEMLVRHFRVVDWITYQDVMFNIGHVIKNYLVVPHEEHDRMLKALAASSDSHWKILKDETQQLVTPLVDKAISARLPSLKRVREVYKLAYDIAVKMNATPLLRAQREGDYEGLAALVRGGASLSHEARDYLADLLTRAGPPPREVRKPPSTDIARKHRTIIWWILRARRSGTKPDASYGAAAEEFDCSERWVRKIYSEHKRGEPELLEKANQLIEQLEYFADFYGNMNLNRQFSS
jgi:hypothetical protein